MRRTPPVTKYTYVTHVTSVVIVFLARCPVCVPLSPRPRCRYRYTRTRKHVAPAHGAYVAGSYNLRAGVHRCITCVPCTPRLTSCILQVACDLTPCTRRHVSQVVDNLTWCHITYVSQVDPRFTPCMTSSCSQVACILYCMVTLRHTRCRLQVAGKCGQKKRRAEALLLIVI